MVSMCYCFGMFMIGIFLAAFSQASAVVFPSASWILSWLSDPLSQMMTCVIISWGL